MKLLLILLVMAALVAAGALHYFSYMGKMKGHEQLVKALDFQSVRMKERAEKGEAVPPAVAETNGDAILAYIQSEKFSLDERDEMVPAIGYMGDPSAVPALKKMLTGQPCDHDAGATRKNLCQHEILKAIERLGGNTAQETAAPAANNVPVAQTTN